MASTLGKVLSVNVGSVREFENSSHSAKSAIWKSPAIGRITARGVNLAGDDQAHGGPDKAVYAYAVEDAGWWQQHIGRSIAYGELSEALSVLHVEVSWSGALASGRYENVGY